MALTPKEKQKKRERKNKKRKEKIQLEGKKKIEIELVETNSEEKMLMQPGLWTFLSTKDTKKLLKKLARELPRSPPSLSAVNWLYWPVLLIFV